MNAKRNIKLLLEIALTGFLTAGLLFSYNNFLQTVPRSVQANTFLEEQLFVEVNYIRKQNNLPELKKNDQLQKAAKNKTIDMVSYKYFAHISPNNKKWSQFIKEEGYNYIFAGENLAKDYLSSKEIINAWVESPAHRENILNPEYNETGIGVSISHDNLSSGILVAQEFGRQVN
jgi:uncharacterized protein YkwD